MVIRLCALTLFLTATSLPAQNKQEEGAYSEVVAGNETQDVFTKLIEKSDLAKNIYSQCQEKESATLLQRCLQEKWGKLSQSQQAQLAEELKKVTVTFENGQQVRKSESLKSLNINPLSTSLSTHTDPAMLKLREHLSKKLSETLYGEVRQDKTGPAKYVDHETFYRLFESQVGQNIILAVSDYCMSSDMDSVDLGGQVSESEKAGLFFIFGSEGDGNNDSIVQENRRKNLANIQRDFSGEGSLRQEAQNRFNLCVKSIPDICYNKKNAISSESPSSIVTRDDGRTTGHYQNISQLNYAVREACLVSEYLTKAREVLTSSAAIRTQLDETFVNSGTPSFQEVESNKIYRGGEGEGELTVQKLAIQTSHDIKESGMDEEAQKLAEEIEQCRGNPEEGVCAHLLSDDLEEKKEILAEEFFRAQAQAQRLKSELEDPEKVREFLESEGHNVDEVIATGGSEEEIKEQITQRYEEQKRAVIEALATQIDQKSVGQDAASTTANIDKIKNSITARTSELSNLLHFANLSSSFIEVTRGSAEDAERSVNTIAAFTELNSITGDESNRSPSQQGSNLGSLYQDSSILDKNKEFIQELESHNSESGNGMDDKGNTTMSVETINEVLDYNAQEQR